RGLLAPRGLVVGSSANRIAHHTSEFASPRLVVRRGQPFDLRVLLPRPFDPAGGDSLCVELTLGGGGVSKWGEGGGAPTRRWRRGPTSSSRWAKPRPPVGPLRKRT
uniref:Transglutaminase N-terminal domain-containing protein n=1 Tax=Accipiter nisus TaxID=211598 RepID=A0A8B9NP06_9AVES